MTNKVVIWGYPPDSHTHSYIHLGFAKAFSYLNYDVIWCDDDPDYADEVKDCIVLTEKNCTKHLPIENSSQYFIHNLADDFEKHEGDNIYNLLVYHEGYNWDVDWQFIDDWSWYDKYTKTVVIMWATDLLPEEVEEKIPVPYNSDRTDINYVGSLDGTYIQNFSAIANSHGKRFITNGGYGPGSKGFVDSKQSIELVNDSYLNFDFRPECHLKNGYIPCRIFKNMSYGCWTGSNSEKILKFFDGRITACEDLAELYLKTEEDSKKATKDILCDNQDYIKKHHTYLNRVNSLLSVL
jgi:hypothetical protein